MQPYRFDGVNTALHLEGSLVFCESPDLIGKMIRFGEWIRWRGGCRWNHVAVIAETATNPRVIQATVDGVTGDHLLETLEGGEIWIVPPVAHVDAENVVRFGLMEVGLPYGYLTLLGIVIAQLSPRWLRFQIGRYGSWICSALGAEAWRCGGWLHQWPNTYAVSPAQLALAVGIKPIVIYPQTKANKRSTT